MNKKINLGFTMIELIVVIAIASILAVGIVMFLRVPVIAYNQTSQRAAVADEAFLIINQMKQDIIMSLPNSVRITTVGSQTYLELLAISNGGRYRTQKDISGTGDILDFTIADNSFDVLSGPLTFTGGEQIVVANIGSPGYNAYNLNNMTPYNGVTGSPVSNVSIVPFQFPISSPNQNFYVVTYPITYLCDTTTGKITKFWNYAISSSQPVNNAAPPLTTGSSALVDYNLSGCSFSYNQGANSRNGIVSISLQLNNGSQTASLYGESYVPNI